MFAGDRRGKQSPWQVVTAQRTLMTVGTVAVSLTCWRSLEWLFGAFGVPPHIVWPLRVILWLAFIVPSGIAVLVDAYVVVKQHFHRLKRGGEDA